VRDYAKKTPEHYTKRSSRKRWWMIGLLAVVILILAIGYHRFHFAILHKPQVPKPVVESQKKPAIKTSKKQIQKAQNTAGQLRYDFYKLLPAMTVTIPSHHQVAPGLHESKSYYVLQVASLQTPGDAKQLKVELTQEGYTTFVQRYQAQDQTVWYRVIVGPFGTQEHAEQQQEDLYKHKIEALLIEVQPDVNQSIVPGNGIKTAHN